MSNELMFNKNKTPNNEQKEEKHLQAKPRWEQGLFHGGSTNGRPGKGRSATSKSLREPIKKRSTEDEEKGGSGRK